MGYVRDSITTLPLVGVSLYRDTLYIGESRADGAYAIPTCCDSVDRWEVSFNLVGYHRRTYEMPLAGKPDSLRRNVYHLDVNLLPIVDSVMGRVKGQRDLKNGDQSV